MYLGQKVLVKVAGIIKEGNVREISNEDLKIELVEGGIVIRKFWEIRKIENEEEN